MLAYFTEIIHLFFKYYVLSDLSAQKLNQHARSIQNFNYTSLSTMIKQHILYEAFNRHYD